MGAEPGKVRRLMLPVERCNKDCIAKLEELLAMAKSGEIVGFHGVVEYPTTYQIWSTHTLKRLEVAGALLDAAVSRVRD